MDTNDLIAGCRFSLEGEQLTVGNPLFSYVFAGVESASAAEHDANGLSLPFMEITAMRGGSAMTCCVWSDLPVVYLPQGSGEVLLTLQGEHWEVRNISLAAFSDENDTFTSEGLAHLFQRSLSPRRGEIFFLENIEDGSAVVLISETPDYQTAVLTVKNGALTVSNGGNGLALGFCRVGECEALCRNYYRHARRPKPLIAMSNTWGDRNGFSRVCRDFILREIDAAKELGVEIVQIDDGWQTGSTADTTRRDALGRREFCGDFWELNTGRFPNGMREITDYAAQSGIRIGLWFAPDSHDGFALLERDISVLRKAYEAWGARFFKLDMFWITSDTDRDRFLELLREIYSFGDDVAVQLDVTRNARMNYLCGRQYGTVFAENRYTKSANAFPHRVLRNLWSLAHYLPASKFQFELVNPALNAECYAPDDPFAPSRYSMDYLFACVMLSNPLFWMEMQFLPQKQREELARILPVWKQCRGELAVGDVEPIWERPCGRSISGFAVRVNGKLKYLLCFREVTGRDTAVYPEGDACRHAEVLASNAEVTLHAQGNRLEIALSEPRSYALIRLDRDAMPDIQK